MPFFVLCTLMALILPVLPARADALETRFPIDDIDPERSVPSAQDAMRAPLQMGYWVMLVSERAEGAEARKDFGAAVKYYRALAKAVPDRATAYGKMCTAYEALGEREPAIASCKAALTKGGAKLEDATRLVHLMLAKPTPLDAAETADVQAVIAHLESGEGKVEQTADEKKTAQAVAQRMRCELALRVHDQPMLTSCIDRLAALAPSDPSTLAFGFALALMKSDVDDAASVVERARAASVPVPMLTVMERRLEQARDRRPLASSDVPWIGALALLALGAVMLRTRRTLLKSTAQRQNA